MTIRWFPQKLDHASPRVSVEPQGHAQVDRRQPEDVTPDSIAQAKAAAAAERGRIARQTGLEIDETGAILGGMGLGNWIAAAVYGPKGEKR